LLAGLPDSRRLAKILLHHLIKTLQATPLAYLHSDYLPPRVLLKPDGTPELMKHEFYYWINTDQASHDLVLYTGDAQPILPEGAFRLSDAVVNLAQQLGVETLVTVGAFITGTISDNPKVYGAAKETDDALKKGNEKASSEGQLHKSKYVG